MTDFFDGIDDVMEGKAKADAEAADAPKFDPKAGETLNAVLLEAKVFSGDYEPTVLITFRNVGDSTIGGVEAGASGVLFSSTVLRRKLLEGQPAVGTPFALRYEGKVTPAKGGNAYHDWTLFTAYEKTGNPGDVDPAMWHTIQGELTAGAPRAQAQAPAANADSSDWKF